MYFKRETWKQFKASIGKAAKISKNFVNLSISRNGLKMRNSSLLSLTSPLTSQSLPLRTDHRASSPADRGEICKKKTKKKKHTKPQCAGKSIRLLNTYLAGASTPQVHAGPKANAKHI